MWPFLLEGDQVTIAHGASGRHPGALIVFRQQDSLAVHRLLNEFTQHGKPVMLLRGDNNEDVDPLLLMDRYVGRVIAIQRGARLYNVDSPLWAGAGWLIALLGRLPMTFESWTKKGRQQLRPGRQADSSGRLRRAMLRATKPPIRLITFLLWKVARHDQS